MFNYFSSGVFLMKLFENKILYTIVAAFVSLSLVAYSCGFYSLQAAEVSTLPAAIDITVDYDSDAVNWVYDGRNYSFSRHYVNTYDIDGVLCTDNISSGLNLGLNVYHYSDSTVLPTVESFQGNPRGASYWFSPSENALYVLSTYSTFNGSASARAGRGVVRSYLVSGGHGCFVFYPNATTSNKGAAFSCYRYDFNSNTMLAGSNSSSSSISSASSFSSFVYYDSASGYTLSGTDTYKVNDTTQHQYYFPTDLLCLYSTYEISGFYQIDSSKVVTPDYYMQYQYIFYLDGNGYTFIDSGEPLTEVTAQGSYAYLTFADTCNKYVYTSVDGITWANLSTVSNIYGGTFTNLPYDWLYDKVTVGFVNEYDAELVYTNDDTFGKPIITPEFGDLTDITDKLNTIVNDNPLSGRLLGALANDISLSNIFNLLAYGIVGDGFDFWINESDPNDHGHFGPRGEADVNASYIVSYPSLATYLYNLVSSSQNLNITLSAFRTDFHADLKSLFDNITLSNTYLSSISDKLGKLSISDYSSALSDIASKLDKLPSGGSGLPSISSPFDDTAILGQLETLGGLLTDIKDMERPDLQTVVKPIKDGFDDVHGDLKYIKTLLTINTIDNLFDDDNDDDTGIVKYLRNVITTLQSGAIISDALTVGSDTMSGVNLLNGYVQQIYTRFPVLAPLVLFPPAVALVNTIMRKGRA